jgi:MarR family transcriptional regulator, organic hydroperoxide resistance regulator
VGYLCRVTDDRAIGMGVRYQLCFALYSASRAVTDLYRPILDRVGLTYPQYLVLLVLWEHPDEPVTVKELGATLRLDSGTLSPMLKRVEAAGLIRRERRATDERVVEVRLTDPGRELRVECAAIPMTIAGGLGISLQEYAQLHQTLEKITNAIHGTKKE